MRISDWSSDVCSSDLRAAIEAGKSANAAIASHEAFVSAEDASLDISFPSGIKVQQSDGVEVSEFYRIPVRAINIGRSTAQISGWRCGSDKHRKQYTVPPGGNAILARLTLRSEVHTSEL